LSAGKNLGFVIMERDDNPGEPDSNGEISLLEISDYSHRDP
jgi:hypothetical protein